METETNTRKVIQMLKADGWELVGGGGHDKYIHPTKPGVIMVPRHKALSLGVARQIARLAEWR